MKQQGYSKYIEKELNKIPYNAIIVPKSIAKKMVKEFGLPIDKALAVCNLKVKQLADKGELSRGMRGLYYHHYPETVFGMAKNDS